MRRARISVKPNVRPGGRSVASAEEDKSSQKDSQQAQSPSQSLPAVTESAVATGDGNVPGSPSEKNSLNTNDGAPSSANTPATTAPQRRSRITATPNLARPKVRSAPPASTGKTALGPSKTSSPVQEANSFPQSPVPVAISRDDSQNSVVTTEANYPPSSPCLPTTSGCPESLPSQQEPHQTPKKIPNEDFGPQEGAIPASSTLSPYVKLSRVDGPDSPLKNKTFTDQQQVLRALKLKELMKLERKKERMERRKPHKREYCIELDRDTMSVADFIYYLPESNPMKSSLSTEETQDLQIAAPVPPIVKKNAEESNEDNDDADDEMLVPKVRVAEDGSLILDEESLTVRVQRTSDTVVENANPLFERGSTTTYSSFRKNHYVRSWSIRETDMFYLAISMVGTDFSMMSQLLTHRTRAEIKMKFKKEERENAWRVDKAFRERRPFDREFFSFLLKRILAKDKEKGKSIKLVVKSSTVKKGRGGKKAKQLEIEDSINEDDELCSVDSTCFDLEKENEDRCNVNETDEPSSTSKKRKRTKDTKPKVQKKKTQKKGKCPVEVEGNSLNTENEDQSSMPVSKKKRKQSKKSDQEEQKERADAKEKPQKKNNKKKLKVQNEEPIDGESLAVNEEHSEVSPVPTKKRKRSTQCAKEKEEATKRKRKTKKGKTSKQECTGSELGADGSEVSTAAPDAEEDQGEKLSLQSTAQEEVSQSSSKRSKRPLPNLAKRKAKKCSEPKATVEPEDPVEELQDESCKEAENESNIVRLAEEQLQKQPVVVLERTPPRLKDSHSSSESQDQPQHSQSQPCSPGRRTRAEKVKRNLTASDDASELSTPGLCAEEDQGEKLSLQSTAQEEVSQCSSKRSKRPLPNLAKRKAKKCSEPKATVEPEDPVEDLQDESRKEAENESNIVRLAEEQLQKQPVVVLERTPPRLKDSHSSSESQDQPQHSQSQPCSPGRRTRAENVKRNLTASDDASELPTPGLCAEEDQGEKLSLESTAQGEISQRSPKRSPGQKTRAEKVMCSLTASEGERMDQCQTESDTSPEDLSNPAMPSQVAIQDSKEMEAGQRMDEGHNFHHLELLTATDLNGQTLPKRPVVLVSHEEVEHYLRVQAQTAIEESTASRCDYVGDLTDGLKEQCSSGAILQEKISQDPEMKETNTASISSEQNITEKRGFIKPTPSLSQAEFGEHTPSLKHDSTQLQCSSPGKVQVKISLNECLSEAEGTCSVSPEEKCSWDKDDARTTVDDLTTLTSVATSTRPCKTENQDISSLLEHQVPDTTQSDKDVTERTKKLQKSQSQISEKDDQITDREEHDSKPCESNVTDIMIEEPQTEVKRIVPVSCSSDGSSVCTQDSKALAKYTLYAKPTSNLEGASQVMINPQQTSEPDEDPAEKPEHQNPIKVQHCDLDHDVKRISREDKLVVSEVDLQECEQDEKLMSPVLLRGSTQTSAPEVSVDSTDPVLGDASSAPFEAHSPVSSIYDSPSEHSSNMHDMDTMLFHESAAENIKDEQASEKQDGTEERPEGPEDCIATLDENPKSEISGSAGVETAATDNQSEEPTFILTLYEIPTSQLFHEAECGQQDTLPYELQPAQVQTPSSFTGSSQSLSFALKASSASQYMESEEAKQPCKSVSHKVLDYSLVPLSKDVAEDASTQLISSQESTFDDVNFLISPPEMLSCNSAMPTEIPTEPPETKAPTQRRSRIKVKPKLKPCVKVGPSQNLQTSNQKTPAQETVSPKIHLSHEDSERGASPEHDGVNPTSIVPCSEDMRDESQVHEVLADASVLSSGEMEDVFNKESPHDDELPEPLDLSVCLQKCVRSPSPISVQKEKVANILKKPDTCREASSVTTSVSEEKPVPLIRRSRKQVKPKIPITTTTTTTTKEDFSRQEQTDIGSNEPARIISQPERIKVERRSKQEDFSDIPKELDTEDTEEVTKTKQQTLFTTVKTSACTDSSPVELKTESGHEDVSKISVPVSMESGRPVQSSLGEESQQVLTSEPDQEIHSHEGVSHMLLTDIFIPVCEDVQDDLGKEWVTGNRNRSPHETERSQMREDPENRVIPLCATSQSSSVGPSTSAKRERPTRGKCGKLLVKMALPKRKAGDSSTSGEKSQTMPPSTLRPKREVDATLNSPETEYISEPKVESTHCSFETFTRSDLLPVGSEDHETPCRGLSHKVLSDILVPVLDESAESILDKEALSVGLKKDAVKVEKSTDIERPPNTETVMTTASQSVSVEWKTPCRRSTLCPNPKLSKNRDDPSETGCQPGSTQTSSATHQQSLDPQAEEWSIKSNMLPMDSDEIENWCEGVSHMLLSDALVPVSEKIGENDTELKGFVSSSPHEDEERMRSEETPSEISDQVHHLDTISDQPKIEESKDILPASQAKKSPARSTFQMTLRSPERRLKAQTNVLKTAQPAPTTPQRAQTSKVKESVGTPPKQHPDACRVELERLSVDEICTFQRVLEPKHHSTPVTVKNVLRGNEMRKASLTLHGSRSPGLKSHAHEEPPVPPEYSPKIVLHRIPITDANTSTATSSPARLSTAASPPQADHQLFQNSPPISILDADKDPTEVSQFFLEDIFTDVVDSD